MRLDWWYNADDKTIKRTVALYLALLSVIGAALAMLTFVIGVYMMVVGAPYARYMLFFNTTVPVLMLTIVIILVSVLFFME